MITGCSAAGTTDRQRGRIAHTTRVVSPTTETTPAGPAQNGPPPEEKAMCGTSSTIPVMAARRCQIAARSMPSNQVSTHGSVVTSTTATDISSTASAPASWPR